MNDRKKPFDIAESDVKHICDARESLMKIRDSMPMIVGTIEVDGTVIKPFDYVLRRREFTEYVNEIIADLEGLLGYD